MEENAILTRLLALQEKPYGELQKKLLPTVAPDSILGIRTPALRALAKEMKGTREAADFLSALPHRYFDENQLHAFLLAEEKDFDRCLTGVNAFLPYVDNWATCDQLSPKVFKKQKAKLLPAIETWLHSEHPYIIRFGLGMLMQHFLDDAFEPIYLEKAAAVRSEEYYVNMMVAWYFATALAKQFDATLPYLRDRRLSPWAHNKTIQKAVESYRISQEQKELLKQFRVK